MGMNVEFNWYLVLKQSPQHAATVVTSEEGPAYLDEYYEAVKDGARLYPIGGVVPIIVRERAVGLAHIRQTRQILDSNDVQTVICYDMLMEFDENDPIGHHYTDMYYAYKKKQEIENHGGKFKLADYVTALERRKMQAAIKELEE